jgi:hypothetical protein
VTPRQAAAFVRKHGVVLESAAGPVPSLAVAIAGGPIRGNWWSHPRSHEIFELTQAIRGHDDVLVCRLVNGKVTFVHRRLWPALVCAAKRFPRGHLAQVHEVHTASGRHVAKDVPFPSQSGPAGERSANANARRTLDASGLERPGRNALDIVFYGSGYS